MSKLHSNIFAFEESVRVSDPAYLLVDRMQDDTAEVRIIVRERGHSGGKGAEIYMSRSALADLILHADAYLKSGQAI